ncbi:hypothetical protein JDV02_001757 [Purpureocillium takamizusanense]|uniref:HTH La-type RNA-binding domain-containing protein n=1 Tax=Purpureocillium takamizusanense TaxID=2060973 RepID=A0A9Q8V861_9HYPO|nr:uncharacterized protein JDV02_001757 [Purpureocillium takamizusanense]UNI15201.1 hypothetical protein JDV02_001757 [Purpureocillium takamizusanense]
MAAPSAFSYAQAAKGHNTLPSAATSANQAVQPQASERASSTTKPSTAAESTAKSSEPTRTAEPAAPAAERQELDSNLGSESDMRSDATAEKRSESKRDDDAGRLDRPWRRTDKSTRSSSTATRSVDEQDSRKPRKNKKTKATDKQPGDQAAETEKEQEAVPEPPKIELSEAPIPSVNIWHQRKEAHLAKAKPATAASEVVTNGEPAPVPGEDTKKVVKPTAETSPAREAATVATTNGTKPPRKATDAPRAERNGSRGSRVAEKDAKESKTELPPPVDDSSSWPTPETAVKEEKKKPVTATVDRQEKEVKDAQDDASQAKPRQKEKWVAYDYVPSVSFETQIPQMRNSKPRGGARGANSTRSPAGAAVADKTAAAAPTAKSGESRDRARESSGASTRAASLPPTAKRASMDLSNAKDQKKAPGHAPGEKTKDAASAHQSEQSGARDRHDGRAERGRGAFRGRGGHHSINSTHSQHQHNGSAYASGSMTSRPQGPYSPPPRQGGHNQMFMPPPQRGGRGRNAAGANFHHRMSLPNGATRPPTVQTQFGPYDFPMAPLSAMPFQAPYWDSVVMQMLKSQIEYYFSIENLCKDMYLRKRMDSQGFVNLHFVAAFKRIRELTSDMGMIRAVCEASVELDYVVGEDEIERLRRRSNWQTFVLPLEERDDLVRVNGPSHITFKNRPYAFGAFSGMAPAPYGVSPPLGYNPQGDLQFQQLPDRHGVVNGMVNGSAGGHGAPTQLSAEVPDFSPSGLTAAGGPVMAAAADKAAVDAGSEAKVNAETSTKALPNGIHSAEFTGGAQS